MHNKSQFGRQLYLDSQGGTRADSQDESSLFWSDHHIANDSDGNDLASLALEDSAVSVLSAMETRPRAFKAKNGVAIVLRGLNTNVSDDPEDMVSVRLWLEDQRIITTHRRTVASLNDIYTELDAGTGPTRPGDFLTMLVEKLADRIGDFVNDLDEKIGQIEDQVDGMAVHDLRKNLALLRKQIATIRRYLAPQRDAIERLTHIETSLLRESDKSRLRDESDRVSRYIEDLDLAKERAILLQENSLAQIAQQQNNRMYALSIITAVFLPLGFLTGLLGINVGGMPGVNSDFAFAIVCGIIIVIAVVIFYLFRRMRWM